MRKFIILLTIFLFLLSSGIGTAEITVRPGESIQTALNNANATSDNLITIEPGIYTEKVWIRTNNLEIRSDPASGNPDNTIIQPLNGSSDNVVSLKGVSNVKISGIGITGAKSIYAGIYLENSNKCVIENNKLYGNEQYGIHVTNSTGNTLSSNKITNNAVYGIFLQTANSNQILSNIVSNNGYGIHLGTSDGNTISGNAISLNSNEGFYFCPKCTQNTVYNNYFNNTVNNNNGKPESNEIVNAYNITKTAGQNIVGGSYLGGNCWEKPDGTGFSQKAADKDGDGIADSPYKIENSIYTDAFPLMALSRPQSDVLAADFKTNTTKGSAPLTVQFTDLSKNAVSWSWDFNNDTVVDSTEQSPVFTYADPGNYTVSLTVSNQNGTASKTLQITVQEPKDGNKIKPVADFSVDTTSGNAPLSVLFTDLSQNVESRNWDINSDGVVDYTDPSFTHVYNDPGVYTANLTVSNKNGTASKTIVIDVQDGSSGGSGNGGSSGESSSHHSSSGGGGGGGGSPEPQSNVEAKEISQTFISNGKSAEFDFTRNVTPVVYVGFDSKKTFGKTSTIAEMLKEKSTLVSEPPSDEVYKYVNIWVGNGGLASSKNIENPVIAFRVEKAWIQDKKIDQSSITLNNYNSDKKWNSLQTNLSGEDDKYLYFTANTSDFSFFSITGKANNKGGEDEVSQVGNESEYGTVTLSNETNGTQPGSKLNNGTNVKSPGFEAIYGVICFIAFFLHKKEKRD
jgi:PGF-pre-PGF domain-containing protein